MLSATPDLARVRSSKNLWEKHETSLHKAALAVSERSLGQLLNGTSRRCIGLGANESLVKCCHKMISKKTLRPVLLDSVDRFIATRTTNGGTTPRAPEASLYVDKMRAYVAQKVTGGTPEERAQLFDRYTAELTMFFIDGATKALEEHERSAKTAEVRATPSVLDHQESLVDEPPTPETTEDEDEEGSSGDGAYATAVEDAMKNDPGPEPARAPPGNHSSRTEVDREALQSSHTEARVDDVPGRSLQEVEGELMKSRAEVARLQLELESARSPRRALSIFPSRSSLFDGQDRSRHQHESPRRGRGPLRQEQPPSEQWRPTTPESSVRPVKAPGHAVPPESAATPSRPPTETHDGRGSTRGSERRQGRALSDCGAVARSLSFRPAARSPHADSPSSSIKDPRDPGWNLGAPVSPVSARLAASMHISVTNEVANYRDTMPMSPTVVSTTSPSLLRAASPSIASPRSSHHSPILDFPSFRPSDPPPPPSTTLMFPVRDSETFFFSGGGGGPAFHARYDAARLDGGGSALSSSRSPSVFESPRLSGPSPPRASSSPRFQGPLPSSSSPRFQTPPPQLHLTRHTDSPSRTLKYTSSPLPSPVSAASSRGDAFW